MQNSDLREDFASQRDTHLSTLLGITVGVGIPLLGLSFINSSTDMSPWLLILVSVLLSYTLRRGKQITIASWLYLVGLLLTFSLSLWTFGPSMIIYIALMLPVVLATLLVDRAGLVWMGLLSIALMYMATVLHTNVLTAFTLTALPGLLIGVLTIVMYINSHETREMIYWAMDIQSKDSRRAEMFYQQKEQLGEALRQLTHAHGRLESLNIQLAESQRKTELASQAKSVFLSNMSHELRTPLNVIIGYSTAMLDMPGMYDNAPLAASYRTDVQLLKDSGYYLLSLINDILDLSKIEAGKLELHCATVSLPEIFKGILATSIGLVKGKPLQIRPDYSNDLPLVWADATRVRQIILNLMSNAIKFTDTGSVTLHAHVEGQAVHISVIDTGIGIPESSIAHIFDRFEQAEQDIDKRYGGTGLGLDISKQLVRMHGDDLTAKSIVGQGSTFSFRLTVVDQQVAEAPLLLPTRSAPLSSSETPEMGLAHMILLVEDEASLRDMMRRTLESVNYVVADIQDGAQMLEMVIGLLPDLIILDIYLPNVDGWQLLKQLRQNAETAAIPVIVCTVSEDEKRALDLGASMYLRKPFSPDELLACTQGLLSSSVQPHKGDV